MICTCGRQPRRRGRSAGLGGGGLALVQVDQVQRLLQVGGVDGRGLGQRPHRGRDVGAPLVAHRLPRGRAQEARITRDAVPALQQVHQPQLRDDVALDRQPQLKGDLAGQPARGIAHGQVQRACLQQHGHHGVAIAQRAGDLLHGRVHGAVVVEQLLRNGRHAVLGGQRLAHRVQAHDLLLHQHRADAGARYQLGLQPVVELGWRELLLGDQELPQRLFGCGHPSTITVPLGAGKQRRCQCT